MSLILSFDIGYASIGWCVLSSNNDAKSSPEFLGTGVVTFPTDDCLASKRRDLRRTRRHIRSTRQRIERMKRWLVHRGVLSRQDLDKPGHPAPFLLAAAALQGHRTLNAWELWTILRWYAHNRGYDGNSRWSSRKEEDTEDTEKLSNARQLMQQHGTTSMAETVCACLKLDPAKSKKTISSHLPYKTLNAAYPRATVQQEVLTLLQRHLGTIPGLDEKTLDLLFTPEALSESDRDLLESAGIKLPKRYHGGLLFGQLIPRFDNRIISRCPITWAKTYDEAIAEGKPDTQARKLADKFAKVPAAKCPEFFRFRFAMLLANLKIDEGKPLPADLRCKIWHLAETQGRVTHKELVSIIKAAGHKPFNLDAYFKIHPDSEDALTLDPVIEFPNKNQIVKAIWPALSDEVRADVLERWKKGGSVTPQELYDLSGSNPSVKAAINAIFDKDKPKAKGKKTYATVQDLLNRKLSPAATTGRAPYARPVLRAVVEEVLSGPYHPLKANKVTDPEDGEDKPANGVLYDLGIPTSRVRQLQNERPLDLLTNNHLVRHRMLILERLVDDLAVEFVSKERPVSRVVVEVARELSKFSGLTAKQIASELNSRLKDFKSAVDYLTKAKEEVPDLEINGSIIRKCRIAMDMNWHCPFTGRNYGPDSLKSMEREHIIPYSTRNTNALHALVLTWPQVNKMKGKRTARQFILDCGGEQVPGMSNLSLMGIGEFDAFVANLDTKKGHADDIRRKKTRQALLATTGFEDKELGFTDGALTQTSHLMKLAMRGLIQRFPNASCDPIPGPVTAEIRKAWDITGTLALACPEVIDSQSGETLPKNDIRGLTHLHHALDAATLALAAHYFPLQSHGMDRKGRIWRVLLKRNRDAKENEFLMGLGIFESHRNQEGKDDVRLKDLPKNLKKALAHSLAQCRVAQHLPADRSGAKTKLTTWGVQEIDNGRVKLRQRGFVDDTGKPNLNPNKSRKRFDKEPNPNGRGEDKNWLRLDKLIGPQPKNNQGKLKSIKGAMIIEENYGLALHPEPTIIPFHDVSTRLASLRKANGGKPVRVLRNGMLIRLSGQGERDGIWSIYTVQASLKIDLVRPGTYGRPKKGVNVWREVSVSGLMNKGLEILTGRYSGYPQEK